MKHFLQHKIFKVISLIAESMGVKAFVIGGFVRDSILGRPCKDIDIVVAGSGIALAEKVAQQLGNSAPVTVYKNFGTAMLRHDDYDIEFVGARKESYRSDSRKPIVEDGSLEDDQKRRDFTINALALSLQSDDYGDLVDPFKGILDMNFGIIRTPLDPDITFSDDPLRMMRAIRFSTQLNFRIEEKCFQAIFRNMDRIKIVSAERISDELNQIIMAPKPSLGFRQLFETKLLLNVFPRLALLQGVETVSDMAHKDNFFHTLQVLDNLSLRTDNLWLRWAALLHDIAKPATKKFNPDTGWTFHGHEFLGSKMVPGIFRQLRLPANEKMKYVQKLVRLHLRPIALANSEVTDSAVRRLLFDAGDDIDDLMLLCEADITSKNELKVKRYLENFRQVRQKLIEVEEKDKIRNWQPPVTGDLIMKTFQLKPGKYVGIIKSAIHEAIIEGIIKNNYEDAFSYMIKKGEELGFKPAVT